MAWAAALPIAKGVLGLAQAWRGGRMKAEQPKYTIPGATTEALTASRNLATGGRRPDREVAEEAIRQSTSNMVAGAKSASTSGNQVMAAIAAANANENNAMRQQDAMDSQFRLNATSQYQNALKAMSDAQNKAFDINKLQPFFDKRARKEALIDGGMNNIFGALDGGMSMLGGGGK
jgi:hypothetical protein